MTTLRFEGNLLQFQDRVASLLLEGEWEQRPKHVWRFSRDDGSGILWSGRKKTIWFEGKPNNQRSLMSHAQTAFMDCEPLDWSALEQTVVVARGKDHILWNDFKKMLLMWGITPVQLRSGRSRSQLIELGEGCRRHRTVIASGFVLLQPDDYSDCPFYVETGARLRASQEGILRLGMLLATLTPARCAIISPQNVELPTNLQGATCIRFQHRLLEASDEIASHLNRCGVR